MKSNRNIAYFFKNLGKKHRLSVRDEHSDSEVWYMHISTLELIGGFIAIILLLFIAVISTVAYTPLLNLLPGYPGSKAREEIIGNIQKVDSIERRLNEMQVYTNDISLILEGRTPVTRNVEQIGDSIRPTVPVAVAPNEIDSILRRQLEGTGIYALNTGGQRVGQYPDMELLAPVRGVVASHFDPREQRFGVGIATATNQQILAVAEGTVIMSTWTPTEGYIIQVQHSNNLVSVYKRSTQSIKPVNTRVRGGEVLGYTGEGISGEDGKGLFEFELWQNGTPVDPEGYIVF